MLSLITVPTDLLATIGTTSTSVFTDLIPAVALVVGIALGIYFAGWVTKKVARRGR